MNFLSHLQFTINAILDNYRSYGKRLYSFSALFAVLSTIWNVLLGFIIILAFSGICNTFNFLSPTNQFYSYSELFYFNITMVSVFLTAVNLSYYALFLIRFWENDSISLSFAHFFNTFKSLDWLNYFAFSIGGSLIYIFCIHYFSFEVNIPNSPDPLTGLTGAPGLQKLLIGFILIIMDYLPGFLGICVIYLNLKRSRSLHLNGKAFLTILLIIAVLGTILFVTSAKIITFLQYFLGGIISIPFVEPLIPSIIMLTVYLFLISAIYPALASCFAAPFLYFLKDNAPEKTLNDSTLLDE